MVKEFEERNYFERREPLYEKKPTKVLLQERLDIQQPPDKVEKTFHLIPNQVTNTTLTLK